MYIYPAGIYTFKSMKLPKIKFEIDWILVIVPVLLAVAGIATLYSITSFSGRNQLALNQIFYLGIGTVVYALFAIFDYKELKNYAWYLYIIGILFLLFVDIFGQDIFGSRRWINLGFFQFQPSELMKIILLIFSTNYFAGKLKPSIPRVITFILFGAIPILLVMAEPDLGTALSISFLLLAVLVSVQTSKKYFLAGLIVLLILAPIGWKNLRPYQKSRITSFVNPSLDPLGSGYNVSQSKIAVGSGGLYGKGFGEATQSQLQFLPIAHVDFIFAGWAEATGFIGSAVLVLVYTLLIWRIYSISLLSRDDVGRVICISVASLILFQSFVNIGMNIGLMPVTGIPLPFVSAGGTSFIINAALLGIVQSVYLRRKSLKFE